MNCQVCDNKFNSTNRKSVKCTSCDYTCCRVCIKTFLLEKFENFKCLNCREEWNRDFICDNFEKSFVNNTYKSHREEVLYLKEATAFQATQPYVEKEIEIEDINEKQEQLRIKFSREITDLEAKKRNLLNSNIITRREFIRQCPNTDCKGFLNNVLKCGICQKYSCSQCREIKEENHVCDPQIVESVKYIKDTSKPCPKCSSLIHKISGCDHMWCSQCHVSFDWRTLKIIPDSRNTNPHFIEYMRNRNITDDQNNNCGGTFDLLFVRRFRNDRYYTIASNIFHTQEIQFPRFNSDRLNDNLRLRIDFMRNKISKEKFKQEIQKREKNTLKKQEIYNVLQLWINCSYEILNRFLVKQENIEEELVNLKNYVNNHLKDISKKYNCVKYQINDMYEFKTN